MRKWKLINTIYCSFVVVIVVGAINFPLSLEFHAIRMYARQHQRKQLQKLYPLLFGLKMKKKVKPNLWVFRLIFCVLWPKKVPGKSWGFPSKFLEIQNWATFSPIRYPNRTNTYANPGGGTLALESVLIVTYNSTLKVYSRHAFQTKCDDFRHLFNSNQFNFCADNRWA